MRSATLNRRSNHIQHCWQPSRLHMMAMMLTMFWLVLNPVVNVPNYSVTLQTKCLDAIDR